MTVVLAAAVRSKFTKRFLASSAAESEDSLQKDSFEILVLVVVPSRDEFLTEAVLAVLLSIPLLILLPSVNATFTKLPQNVHLHLFSRNDFVSEETTPSLGAI